MPLPFTWRVLSGAVAKPTPMLPAFCRVLPLPSIFVSQGLCVRGVPFTRKVPLQLISPATSIGYCAAARDTAIDATLVRLKPPPSTEAFQGLGATQVAEPPLTVSTRFAAPSGRTVHEPVQISMSPVVAPAATCAGMFAQDVAFAPAVSTWPACPRARTCQAPDCQASRSPVFTPCGCGHAQARPEAPAVSTWPAGPMGSTVQKPGPGTACQTSVSPVAEPEGKVAPPPPPPDAAITTSTQSCAELSVMIKVTLAPCTKLRPCRVPFSALLSVTLTFCTLALSATLKCTSPESGPPPCRP